MSRTEMAVSDLSTTYTISIINKEVVCSNSTETLCYTQMNDTGLV